MKLKSGLLATSLILFTSAHLHAADASWSSTATTGNWSDTTKWTGGAAASGPTSTATFGTDITAATVITQDVSGLQIGNISFSDNGASGSAWTLSGTNSITLGDGASVASSTITTITPATISSILAGANSLTKAGAATLTLSGANTYTGGTILNGGGSLAVGNATALGTGAVSVNSSSTLSYSASFANNIVLNSSDLSVSGNFTDINGVISGTGNVTVTGTVQIKGTNTYTGKTLITGGYYCFRSDSAFGTVPSSFTADSITVSGGAALSTYITGTAFSLNANRGIVLAAGNTGEWDIAANLTIPGVISGPGVLRKGNSNGGALILTNANTYSGGTLISNGILSIGTGGTGANTSSVDALGTGSVALNNATATKIGTLRLWIQNANSFTIPNNFTMNGGVLLGQDGIYTLPGTIALGANGGTISATWPGKTVTSTGVISGAGPLIITQNTGSNFSGGGVTLSGANTYTGATSILGATLSVSSINSVSGGTATSNLGAPTTVPNGTLVMGSFNNTAGLTYTGTGETTDRAITFNGSSGGATFTQSGTGLLTFTGAFTNAGVGRKTVTVSGSTAGSGELSGAITDNATTGSTALVGTFGIGATTATLGSVDGVSVGASISGTGIAAGTTVTAVNSSTKVVTLSTAATAASAAAGTNYTVTGVVNRTDLSKTGSGAWKLSGANTYSGGTTVAAGTLTAISGALGSTIGSLSMTGGTLDLNAASHIVGPVTLTGGTIQNGTLAGASYSASAGTNTVSAILAGSSGLSVSGGTLALSAANTYSGGTTLSGGTLTVANTSALSSGSVTVTGNSTINATSNFSNNIAINTAVNLGFGGGFAIISGVISGPGAIVTSNSGVIQGVNTYAGGTTINGGFLCINNDAALGAVPVSFSASNIAFSGGGSLSTYPVASGTNVSLNANRGITFAAGNTGGFDPINGTTLTVNGIISGAGGVRHSSGSTTGTLVLNGLNTYTGQTVLARNTTEISSLKNVGDTTGSSLGNPADAATGTIDLGSGTVANTTLRYVGTGSTTDRVINLAGTTGSATLDQSGAGLLKFTSNFTATGVGSKTLTLTGSSAGTGEISGAIVDNSVTDLTSVTKSGTGTWLLTGANTYTGNTTVYGGTLGGSGCATSAFYVNSTGVLAPGASVGTFLASSAMFTNSTFAVEVDRSTTTADKMVVPGVVDLLDTNLTVSEIGSGTVPSGTKFTIVDYTGGSLIGGFNGLSEGATINVGSMVYTIHYADSSKITLTVTSSGAGGYDTWAAQITNGKTLRTQDADDDGFTNLQEFLFGTNPMAGNGSLTTTEKSGGTLIIRWKEREVASEADYLLKESATLTNPWSNSSAPVTNDGAAAGGYQPRRANVTIGSGKLFFRVEGVETN